VGFVRDAAWLSGERARAYGWMLLIFMAAGLGYDWASTIMGHHPWGMVPGVPGKAGPTDFVAFWSAGQLVWEGHPASAYRLAALSALEHATTVMDPDVLLAFFYPPTFLLFCLPFAALPYLAGLAGFVGVPLSGLALGLRRILAGGGWRGLGLAGFMPVLAFPGLLMNAATGQTGFWSAAFLAWALIWLEARPVLAGACLGLLVIKPHLALVVPFGLAAGRRWRALGSCAAMAAAWMLASWLVLGTAAWRGFFASGPAIRDALENHAEDWGKLQSFYTLVRFAGGSVAVAYGAQLLICAAVLAAMVLIIRRRPGAAAEVALMAGAAMLCTPHILDYDLAAAGVPLAWMASRAMRGGWLPWEKVIAGLAFLWPLVARLLTQSGAAPVGPLILLGLFLVTCRRAARADHVEAAPPNPFDGVHRPVLRPTALAGVQGAEPPGLKQASIPC
jgi:hypothetical protein